MTTLTGTYRFYENGVLIGESKNLLTDEGKNHIMRYLAGQENVLAGSIALGTSNRAAATSDSRLTFEFDRVNIYLSSPDYISRKIILKGSIGVNTVGSIYEIGAFSTNFGTSFGNPSRPLAIFERSYEDWSGGAFATGNQRVGLEALRLAPATNGTLASSLALATLDLSNYSGNDEFSFAFHSLNTNTSSVRFRFIGSDPAAYYEHVVSAPVPGYNVVSVAKKNLVKAGIVDWSLLSSIEVAVSAKSTGAAQVDFDGIRVESTTLDYGNTLISHSVLTTPIVTVDGTEMDIEYALEVSF